MVIRIICVESRSPERSGQAEGQRQSHLASVHPSLQDLVSLWRHMGKSVGRVWGLKSWRQVHSCPFIPLSSLPKTYYSSPLSDTNCLFSSPLPPYFFVVISQACGPNYRSGFIHSGTTDILGQMIDYWGGGAVLSIVGRLAASLTVSYQKGTPSFPLPSFVTPQIASRHQQISSRGENQGPLRISARELCRNLPF